MLLLLLLLLLKGCSFCNIIRLLLLLKCRLFVNICIPSGISETWRSRLFAPEVVPLDTSTDLINSVRGKQKYYTNILFKFYGSLCGNWGLSLLPHYHFCSVFLIWALAVCSKLNRSKIKCGFPNVLFSSQSDT